MKLLAALAHFNRTVSRIGLIAKIPLAALVAATPAAVGFALQLPLASIFYVLPGAFMAVTALLVAEPLFTLSATLAEQGVDGPLFFMAASFLCGFLFWWALLLWIWRKKPVSTQLGAPPS